MQAPDPAGQLAATPFNLLDLQHLVSLGYGAHAARPLLWSLAPFEYLARRRNPHGPKQLVVEEVPVAELIPHIPWMLQYCRSLIDSSSSPATAHEAARKASTFTARLLEVLSIPAVQDRLGGRQQLQPSLDLLGEALPAFRQRAVGGQQLQPALPQSSPGGRTDTSAPVPPAPAGGSDGGAAAATAAAAAAAAAGSPFASCQAAAMAAAAAAAAAGPAAATPATDAAAAAVQQARTFSSPTKSTRKGMHLAALLKAIEPFTRQPGSPFPPDFSHLLSQWARLVYGELAEPRSVQVAALLLYHWRTLLRFLRLCLQGLASLSSSASSASSSGPMLVSTAASHTQALLHLLHNEPIRALFTPQQYRRVTDRLVAIKTLLAGLPQTPAGTAAAVDGFGSAAVAALVAAGTAQLPPLAPAAPKPGPSARPSAGQSSQLSESQHQLLSAVKSQLQQAGVLNPQHLDAVQEVLNVLRRQIAEGSGTGSDRLEATLLPE